MLGLNQQSCFIWHCPLRRPVRGQIADCITPLCLANRQEVSVEYTGKHTVHFIVVVVAVVATLILLLVVLVLFCR